jgi:phage repressor protein C with HTH and peptisase S24 domain
MQTIDETRRQRLQILIDKYSTLAALNEALGLARTDATLSQIKNKSAHSKTGTPRCMGDPLARRIEERLGLPLGWMDTPPSSEQAQVTSHGAASEALDGSDHPSIGNVRFPVLELAASAGPGREPADYAAVLGHIDLAEQWARKRLGERLDRIRVLPVKGDSMSPTINDGDLAFVDTSCNHFEGEGVYVLVFNQALLIKRLSADFATQRIQILSDNGHHKPALAREDELTICGRVRAWMSVKGY